MKKKGLFVVEEFKNFNEHSGAYVHTMISFNELSKDFEMNWFERPINNNKEKQGNSITKKTGKSNFLKGSLKDLKIMLKELISIYKKVRFLRQEKYDFMYCRIKYLGFSWIIASKLSKTPIFIEVNGIFSLDIKKYRKSIFNKLVKLIEKSIYKNSTHGFYVGGINYELGLSGTKYSPVQNGIWGNEIQPIPKSGIKEKYSDQIDKIKLVFVGHIMSHHKLNFLIESINQMENAVEFELHIIGKENPNIELSKNLKFPILFYGSKNNEELHNILKQFHFGVIAYAKDYYSNMKLFTYLANGLPIIIPKTRNFKHIFRENIPFFFENLDQNSLILTLNSLRHENGNSMYNRINLGQKLLKEHYTWNKIYEVKREIILKKIA